ncbi:MAG: PP2C family protein-serine/threonine phosphatase [Candidatus Eutrophobiaceae bacterium]
MNARGESRIFKNIDLDSCQKLEFAHGHCIVYTCQSPIKNSGNEDSIAVINIHDRLTALVVADGIGGYEFGAEASSIVVTMISNALLSCPFVHDIHNTLAESLQEASNVIRDELPSSGSTVTVAIVDDSKVSTCHAGDSEFIVSGLHGEILGSLVAHSPVGRAVASGLLDERSAMFHSNRHIISNAIGSTELDLEFSEQPYQLKQRETIVLGSDGLFDNLYKNEISEIAAKKDLLAAGQHLVETCNSRMSNLSPETPHKPDDLSLILFRLKCCPLLD